MSDLRAIDLNLLVALEALLAERNVTRAARRLGLTQPAVSGMLARLRALFDDPLFVRSRHGIAPTPRAETLAEPLARWIAEARELVSPERFDPATSERSFAISLNDYMQATLLQPLLRALRRRAPRTRVALWPPETAELGGALERGRLDLAVTIPDFAPQDLPSRALYEDRYVAIVRAGHPLRARRPSLDAFCRLDHVLVSPSGGGSRGPTDLALAALGRRRRVALTVSSFLLVPELVQGSDLVAVVPERLLRGRRARLRVFPPPVELAPIRVIAVWHGRSQRDPAHVWLRGLLADVARRR